MKQDWEIVALDDSIAKRKETRNAIILESGKTRIVSKIDFNDGQIQLSWSPPRPQWFLETLGV